MAAAYRPPVVAESDTAALAALDAHKVDAAAHPVLASRHQVFVQQTSPAKGALPWLWLPINSSGVWDGTSHVYAPVPPAPPVNTVAPAITGSAVTGQTLTASTGTWTGSPTPTYTYAWKRNGAAISGATASTYVLQVADKGTTILCTVTATNASGTASADSNTLTPTAAATAPGTPTGLTATAGNGRVTLAWTAPASDGGSAITDYLVEYRTGANPFATFADAVTATTGATVTGLTNGTAYDFRVSAINAVGTGAPSNTATATPAAAAFDPMSLNPLAWFKPESLSALADGTAVATWPDSSGNARDLTQATAAAQPVLKKAIQNGKDVVRMSPLETGDYLQHFAAADWITGTTLTAYVVSKRASARTTTAQMSLYAAGATNDYGAATGAILGYTGGSGEELMDYRAAALSQHVGGEGLTFHSVTHKFDGTNNTLFFDGVAETPVASTGAFAVRNMLIGARWDGAIQIFNDRDYGEILVYAGAHGTTDRQNVEQYLRDRWATP